MRLENKGCGGESRYATTQHHSPMLNKLSFGREMGRVHAFAGNSLPGSCILQSICKAAFLFPAVLAVAEVSTALFGKHMNGIVCPVSCLFRHLY